MELSPQQRDAYRAVQSWLKNPQQQVFRLFGYAGTGKTTIAKQLAEGCHNPLFAAYTGKAAHVMRQSGCHEASTLHSLAYYPRPKGQQRLRDLEDLFLDLQTRASDDETSFLSADMERVEEMIRREQEDLRQPAFQLNPDSDIRRSDLLIIDECSMVGKEMAEELMTFGTPILALGDPAQLPPVRSVGYFTCAPADRLLTEIHRQAMDSPIIKLATDVREGRGLCLGDYGDAQVLSCDTRGIDWSKDTQVLVGRNATRRKANARIRSAKGLDKFGPLPVAGDRLVCLRNNHSIGLLNGAFWNVCSISDEDEDKIYLRIQSDDSDKIGLSVGMWKAPFLGEDEPQGFARLQAESFSYGYALTVHKAQGSQWEDVTVIDESKAFGKAAKAHLYTAVTRASKRLTVYK